MRKTIAAWLGLCLISVASAQITINPQNTEKGDSNKPPLPNPRSPVDYIKWLNERFSKRNEDNAADNYRDAIRDFVDDDKAGERLERRLEGPWNEADRSAAAAWVEKNRDCLDQIGLAVQRKSCYFERDPKAPDLTQVELPHMKPLRGIARLLATRATLRLASEDIKNGMSDVSAMLKLSAQLDAQPSLIEAITGIAIAIEAYETVRLAPRYCGDKLNATAMLDQLRRIDRGARTPTRNLEFDRIMLMDVLQRYLKDEDNDGKFDAVQMPGSDKQSIKPTNLALLLKSYDACVGEPDKIFLASYPLAQKLLDDNANEAAKAEPFIGLMAPDLRILDRMLRAREGARSAARLVLRLFAYKTEHGKWPETLDDATKGEPLSVRMDPFSGDDLLFKPGDPPTIYSLGPNAKDDGGKLGKPTKRDDDGDFVYWPPSK